MQTARAFGVKPAVAGRVRILPVSLCYPDLGDRVCRIHCDAILIMQHLA